MKIKEILTFHFGKPCKGPLFGAVEVTLKQQDKQEAMTQNFIKDLGLKVFSGCWSELDLSSPVVEGFIKKVTTYRKEKWKFIGFNIFQQHLVMDEDNDYEWFELSPKASVWECFDNTTTYQDVPVETIKAYKVPAGVNAGTGQAYQVYFSEKAVNVIKDNGLRGIDFVWLLDKGKYKAEQWYNPIPQMPIGRGIDHPWFNTDKLEESNAWQPEKPEWRTGVYRFDKDQIRNDARLDSETQKRVLDLYQDGENLAISSFKRYCVEELPDTDFAFNWKEEDKVPGNPGSRHRGLCLNKRAKDVLMKNKIISESELEPIAVFSKDEPGLQVVAPNCTMPFPLYTTEEVAVIQPYLDKEYAKCMESDKPVREIKEKELLSLLRKQKKDNKEDFPKGVKLEKFESLLSPFPEIFGKVYKISNGCQPNLECEFEKLDKIESLNKDRKEYLDKLSEGFGDMYFYFAYAPNGDWYGVNVDNASDEYGGTVRISHETNDVDYKWGDFKTFLLDMLTGFYD